jgi:hypothetical protein
VVLCSLVLCVVADRAEYAAVLDDLAAAVKPGELPGARYGTQQREHSWCSEHNYDEHAAVIDGLAAAVKTGELPGVLGYVTCDVCC